MPVITNVEDLRILAQKRVPRMFHNYSDSGAWTESTYRANTSDFARVKLRQRVAVNIENQAAFPRIPDEPDCCVITTRTAAQHTLFAGQDRHPLPATVAKNAGIDTP